MTFRRPVFKWLNLTFPSFTEALGTLLYPTVVSVTEVKASSSLISPTDRMSKCLHTMKYLRSDVTLIKIFFEVHLEMILVETLIS